MQPRSPQETTERVRVFLADGSTVEGNLHVPRHARMLDMLNHQSDQRPFFALTEVVWTRDGSPGNLAFLCLHRAHVLAVHPVK